MPQISMVTRVAESVIMPVAVPMGYMSSLTVSMLFKNTKKERERASERQSMLHAKSFLWAWWLSWRGPVFIRLPMGLASVDALKWFRHKRGRWPRRPNPSRAVFNPIKGGVEPEERRRDKHCHPSRWGRVETPGSTRERTLKKGSKGRTRHKNSEVQSKKKKKQNLTWTHSNNKAIIEKTNCMCSYWLARTPWVNIYISAEWLILHNPPELKCWFTAHKHRLPRVQKFFFKKLGRKRTEITQNARLFGQYPVWE